MEVDLPPPPRQFPSVLDMDNDRGGVRRRSRVLSPTTASEDSFGGSPAQYHHPDIRLYEHSLFWILTPDGDVYPELLHVPPATGLVWLNERDAPLLTTMTPAGRHVEQVYGLGALRRTQLSPEVTVRAVLGAQETENTCRERAAATATPESGIPGLLELDRAASPFRAPPDTTPRRGVSD